MNEPPFRVARLQCCAHPFKVLLTLRQTSECTAAEALSVRPQTQRSAAKAAWKTGSEAHVGPHRDQLRSAPHSMTLTNGGDWQDFPTPPTEINGQKIVTITPSP